MVKLNHLPTGGDTASHVFYAAQFCDYFPRQGLTQWLPEVFGGLLFFVLLLSFAVHCFLFKLLLMPFAVAFKWAVFLAAIAMPPMLTASSVCLGF